MNKIESEVIKKIKGNSKKKSKGDLLDKAVNRSIQRFGLSPLHKDADSTEDFKSRVLKEIMSEFKDGVYNGFYDRVIGFDSSRFLIGVVGT